MKVSTENTENRQAILNIEAEPKEMEESLDVAYNHLKKKINIHRLPPRQDASLYPGELHWQGRASERGPGAPGSPALQPGHAGAGY